MDRVVITRAVVGICHMQVCAVADATDDEILVICNRENPSGTMHGWSDVCRNDHVLCEERRERRHFLVSC